MEIINCNFKSANASKLVDIIYEKNAARKAFPSRYRNQNNVSFHLDQANKNFPFLARPPNTHSNTQSDPLGLKRALLAKKFPFLTPRRKRTVNRSNPAKILQSSVSEPNLSLNNDIVDLERKMDLGERLPAQLWENVGYKQTGFPNDNPAFQSPARYDKIYVKKNEIFVKKDKTHSGSRPTVLSYNPIRALQTRDDDTISDSCSTNYASSSDDEIYVIKYPKIRHRKPKVGNRGHRKRSSRDASREHLSNTNSRYPKEAGKLSRQRAVFEEKEHQTKQKGLRYKLDKNDLYKMIDIKCQRQQLQERRRACDVSERLKPSRLPETNVEHIENRKNNNELVKCDIHPKLVKRTWNPESQSVRLTPNKKVKDAEVWNRFQKIFKKYASIRNHSASSITHELSTLWMKNAGLLEEFMNEEEAAAAFKKVAGPYYTMNIYQYKEFLINLTIKKKLPLYGIYRRMCGL